MKPVSGESDGEGRKRTQSRGNLVRLSINLSTETAETLKALAERKGVTITEGIRRAIIIWKFMEDEISQGNQIAVIQKDETIRKVLMLLQMSWP
jgi:predicted DNA-binding protein